MTAPERPTLEGLESTWDAVWQRDGSYRFDRSAARDRVYAIDTPPPTVSGQLHEIDSSANYLTAVRAAADDLRAAGSVQEFVLTEAEDDRVAVELA